MGSIFFNNSSWQMGQTSSSSISFWSMHLSLSWCNVCEKRVSSGFCVRSWCNRWSTSSISLSRRPNLEASSKSKQIKSDLAVLAVRSLVVILHLWKAVGTPSVKSMQYVSAPKNVVNCFLQLAQKQLAILLVQALV